MWDLDATCRYAALHIAAPLYYPSHYHNLTIEPYFHDLAAWFIMAPQILKV